MTQEKPLSKVQKLELKLKAARKEEAQRLAKQRAKEKAAEHEAAERKLRLVGQFMLDGCAVPTSLKNTSGLTFEKWLKAGDDRKLFGLEPLQTP